MRIRVTPEQGEAFTTELADFAAANRLEAHEIAEIVSTLVNGLDYVGGGGAAPFYTIERLHPDTGIRLTRKGERAAAIIGCLGLGHPEAAWLDESGEDFSGDAA